MLRLILTACVALASVAAAQSPKQGDSPSIAHPPFELLDEEGEAVTRSGKPVSSARTCGTCHDTEYIAGHSYHASVGLDEMAKPGSVSSRRPWDTSPGLYGRWDPLLYRYLTPDGDEIMDLGTADWISALGYRHAGGGPAVRDPSRAARCGGVHRRAR